MKKTYTYEEVVKISQEMVYLYSWFGLEGKWDDPGVLDEWTKKRVDLYIKNGPGLDTFTDTPIRRRNYANS